jgi:multidrug efflux pump subunit AcrA (membrane-fusion protein)/Cu/Ag efflux protein CusF
MKPATLFIVFISAGLAGAIGYQWGKQRPVMEQQAAAKAERKILYYRNAMGLPDTSPAPKKDQMGMDYVPVYEGGEESGSASSTSSGQVVISVEKVQKLGVKTEPAQLRHLMRSVRATAAIQANERNLHWIAPRFEGWVRQLHVNATGQQVTRGQPLLTVYSPELQSTAREYQLAVKSGMNDLADSSLQRLRNWEVMPESADQVPLLATDNLVLRSPVNGVVLEKIAVSGARFMPGEVLFKLADLSMVWVQAEVAEQDQAMLRVGQTANVTVDAYPGAVFPGKVSFIAPVLNPQTRTVQVRVELPNRDGKLRPAMYASVQLATEKSSAAVLAVPTSAVIDSGTRAIVLVQLAQGRFEPREVRLGSRSDDYVEVLDGVAEGEQVVVAANFLIDAESNLKAALGGFGHAQGGGAQGVPVAEHTEHAAEQPKPAAVGHQAQGKLDTINADGTVSITHEAIKTLGWPGMTMDFALANSALVQGIQPGRAISFEIVERKPGEWVITKLQAKPASSHDGH